jgi:hypothetical protein
MHALRDLLIPVRYFVKPWRTALSSRLFLAHAHMQTYLNEIYTIVFKVCGRGRHGSPWHMGITRLREMPWLNREKI